MSSQSVAIRAAGLFLILAGASSMRGLYVLVNAAPRHPASPAELVLAGAGFVCISLGAVLVELGSHLFDRVRVSARWASTLHHRPARRAPAEQASAEERALERAIAVHPATTEPSRFAYREQSRHGLAVLP